MVSIETTKSVTLVGSIAVDGVNVRRLTAAINSEKPAEYRAPAASTLNVELYRANRDEIRKLEAEFEDAAYEMQAELMAGEEE